MKHYSAPISIRADHFTLYDPTDPTKKVKFSASGITTATTRTLTAPDATDTLVAAAASQSISGKTTTGGTGSVLSKVITFTEDATSTTHTGTVTLPAGSMLHNIQICTTVLWTGGTATMVVGDADDPDGWFASFDLKATDHLVGEVLDISNAENWGGKQGVYMVAATGRKGTSGVAGNSGTYYGVAKSIIGVVTVGTPATTAGRTFMCVTYSVPEVTAATAA